MGAFLMKKKILPIALCAIMLTITSCDGNSSSIIGDSSSTPSNNTSSLDSTQTSDTTSNPTSNGDSTTSNNTPSNTTTDAPTSAPTSDTPTSDTPSTPSDTTDKPTSDTPSSSDSSSSSSSSDTNDDDGGKIDYSKYDSLASLHTKAANTMVKCLGTVTGIDGTGAYIQDPTGGFYVFYKNQSFNNKINDLVEFNGQIGEFGGNKQLTNFTATLIDTNKINPIDINSAAEINSNKYQTVSAKIVLTTDYSYTSGGDLSLNAKIGSSDIKLFVKKTCPEIGNINTLLKNQKSGSTITIKGGFANSYNGTPEICLTSASQVSLKEPETDQEKLEYAISSIQGTLDLNNTTITSDLIFPVSEEYGITYKWISSNTSAISNYGNVIRPQEGETDVAVTLTVEISIDGVKKDTKTINLTVKAIQAASGDTNLPESVKKYYSNIDFTNSKESLKTDLGKLINKHTVIGYKSLQTTVYKDSDIRPDGKVWDIYSSTNYKLSDYSGTYKKEGDCFNKEHAVPQSWFGKSSPYVSDAFHIYPSDGKVNGIRSSYLFGNVKSGTEKYTSTNNCRLGTSKDGQGTVFEVTDEYKGDIARSYFYMATAYQDVAGNWGHHFVSSNYTKLTSYSLNLFREWAKNDPVSEKEINRNNGIYKHQNNRNPFIDYPELASYIFD